MKKNYFITNLTKSNESIKASRAERIATLVKMEQEALVNNLTKDVMNLENKLDNLEDLSPDSELSLSPVGDKDFDANKWVNAIQDTEIELANKRLELDIAKKTYDKYFTIDESPNAE